MKLDDIIIDDEFASYLPALSDEERERLLMNMTLAESRGEKFSDLYVWKGRKILIDGHHRYEIAQLQEIDLPIVEVDLKDRSECLEWMRNKQLGQRNLTADQRKFYIGEKYNTTKGKQGGDRKSKSQDDTLIDAAELVAKEHNVSPATVKRAGKFAEEVAKDPEKKKAVLSGKPVEKPKPEKESPAPPSDDYLKRSRNRFSQVNEEVSSLARVLKELASEDVGRYVNTARLNSAFKEIRTVLKDCLPVAKCQKCSGKGCILCKETGYVTQAHLEG